MLLEIFRQRAQADSQILGYDRHLPRGNQMSSHFLQRSLPLAVERYDFVVECQFLCDR